MPNIYQIELNLKGDLNAKLDDAIKKAQNLKSITNNIGGREVALIIRQEGEDITLILISQKNA